MFLFSISRFLVPNFFCSKFQFHITPLESYTLLPASRWVQQISSRMRRLPQLMHHRLL